jgi:hypothetical protein
MSDGYEVGYGKPPKTGQWQAGKSGNPAGSSKKAKAKQKLKTLQGYYLETLNEQVEVTFDGKTEKMPLAKAIAKSMAYGFMKASPMQKLELFEKHKKLGLEELQSMLLEEAEFPDELPLTPTELELLELMKAEEAAWEAMNNEKEVAEDIDCDAAGERASTEIDVDLEETLAGREN